MDFKTIGLNSNEVELNFSLHLIYLFRSPNNGLKRVGRYDDAKRDRNHGSRLMTRKVIIGACEVPCEVSKAHGLVGHVASRRRRFVRRRRIDTDPKSQLPPCDLPFAIPIRTARQAVHARLADVLHEAMTGRRLWPLS